MSELHIELARDNSEPMSPFRAERERWSSNRLILSFVALHLASFLAELLAILNFLSGENYSMVFALLCPLLLSGLVCGHAAWRAEVRQLRFTWGLPLKSKPCWMKPFLLILHGLFQGVIVLLAWDDYLDEEMESQESSDEREKNSWNRFHCKAVAALCEGLPAITVITCAWCSLGYPVEDPLMVPTWSHERDFLRVVGFILFLSTGFGIVELDLCCSGTVAKKMDDSRTYEILHLVFRVSEVLSRTVMHVMFVVTTRRLVPWWWGPSVSNLIFSFLLVLYYGGEEKRFLVRLLCSLPCTWVNIFFFVDSPYKRRAARRISRWLEVRFLLEVLVMPCLVCWAVASRNAWENLESHLNAHPVIFLSLILCLFIYAFVWLWMQFLVVRHMDKIDIFSACERGDVTLVKEALQHLVSEIRELTRSASAEIDFNKPDVDGNTLLILAARQGHAELCDYLVKQGAFISSQRHRDSNCLNCMSTFLGGYRALDWTALHVAAWQNHAEVIRVLMDNGALKENRHYVDAKGQTPLHIAARAKASEAAAVLLSRCPEWIDAQDLRGRTPMDLAPSLREVLPQSTAIPSPTSCPLYSRRLSMGDWRSVDLRISRKRLRLEAPGLCSYVAASCGGALGRLCLSEAPSMQEDAPPPVRLEDLEPINSAGQSCQVIEALIGEGAGGRVYRARHRLQTTAPLYAVKVFKAHGRRVPAEVARECEVGTCVRQTPHPCIVRLFMIFFDEDSRLYTLVMEFCPSTLFQQILRAKERAIMYSSMYRPPNETLDWLGQIFLGLEHMHRRLNILFRDLKPDNVVIDQHLCAKLADFGSGRFGASSGAFSFGHPPGTVGYCAPEVLFGHPHDECADLYSLGVVTWLLFTGGMHNTAPPVSQRPEFASHYQDWAQLHHCIQVNFPPFRAMENMEEAQAQLAGQFTWSLLLQQPQRRLKHRDIRNHPLLQPLQLPGFADGPETVEHWLQRRTREDERPKSTSSSDLAISWA